MSQVLCIESDNVKQKLVYMLDPRIASLLLRSDLTQNVWNVLRCFRLVKI
jgi:hypothetical protein